MRILRTTLTAITAVLLVAALPATAQQKGSTPPASVDPTQAVPIQAAPIVIPGAGIAGISAMSSPNCGSGNGCVWTQTDFNGSKKSFSASDAGQIIVLGNFDRSAANRFNSRYMAFYRSNGAYLSCVNAGNNDRNLYAETDLLVIGGPGSNC